MRTNKQRGAVSLFVASILLIAALAMSLASYRNLFFQIKRAQNEIDSRKAHWLAEGGVECAFALVASMNSTPTNFSDCAKPSLTISLNSPSSTKHTITANISGTKVKKSYSKGFNSRGGAIQSSADLYFHTSTTFSTPDPGELTVDGWECVALRYKNQWAFHGSITNSGVVHGDTPYAGFNNQGKDCRTDHKTNVANSSQATQRDFLKDTSMNLFYDFFGVKPDEHNKVRDNGIFTQISNHANDCGTAIKDKITQGKLHIWVEGSCEIKADEYEALATASMATDGVLILVHDGVLSLMGGGTGGEKIKGILFHFNYEFLPQINGTHWNNLDAKNALYPPGTVNRNFPTDYLNKATFYQHGAFTMTGGQILDLNGQAALFYTSLNMRYNGDVFSSVFDPLAQPRWVKGSWHDF
ncbi:hypothetical protein AADU72_004592 [Vibrio vulnificus]